MDCVSPATRSRIMSAIRARGNRTTEWRLRALLAAGVRGWCLHPPDIEGHPDFVFPALHIAVFVDGCFWHGCPSCFRLPRSRRSFWKQKIERNRARDRRVRARLRRQGWSVLSVWEHHLVEPSAVLRRIQAAVNRRADA